VSRLNVVFRYLAKIAFNSVGAWNLPFHEWCGRLTLSPTFNGPSALSHNMTLLRQKPNPNIHEHFQQLVL
jgi:hypothetical protein